MLPLLTDTFTTVGMTDYVVQSSTDKVNWTTLQTVTSNTNVWKKFTFSTPVTARYIRVTCSAGNGAFRLIELEAWGQ